MLEVKNISKIFDGQKVLKNISFTINDEKMISIVGKSGSGKTTLLNIIGSLERADEGEVIVDDRIVTSMKEKDIADYRNNTVGFVFQSFHLEYSYDVYHNIAIPLLISGKKNIEPKIMQVLDEVGLKDKKKVKVSKLSGGEQQRICIARAIVNEPKIILADEPCGNLDSYNSKCVMDLLLRLCDHGKKVIMVTHDLDDARRADRILSLEDGMISGDDRL